METPASKNKRADPAQQVAHHCSKARGAARVNLGTAAQQLTSNIMLGLLQDSFRGALFNDPAAVHDDDLVSQSGLPWPGHA